MLAINNNSLKAKQAFKYKNKNSSYCTHCNKSGYIINKCFIKYPELKNKVFNNFKNNSKNNSKNNFKNKNKDNNSKNKSNKESTKLIINAFSIINSKNNKNKIILDSGASKHYISIKD